MNDNSLFSPVIVGDLTLQNRIAMAPMTRGRAGSERIPNDLMAQYYLQRASAGIIITEATVISAQGNGWVDSPGIYTDEMTRGWKLVTEALRPTGTPLFLQLWHCGRVSHSDFHNGEPPVSASAVKLMGDHIRTPKGKKPYETPRALTLEEIAATIGDYRGAATRAREAGFDGVELHAANGYLVNQFLDGKTNLRTDRYGGSLENRSRFLMEALAAILEVWPANRVGVRLSPNGVFNDMGAPDFRELYLHVLEGLAPFGLAYAHIMDGLAFGFHEQGEPLTLAECRRVYPGVIMANCGYTKELAEQKINSKEADLVAFGRPYISNPDLVERLQNDWPLTPAEDMSRWYTPGPEGYTDYPPYRQ
jgi:N-ethylmaleimide reductase